MSAGLVFGDKVLPSVMTSAKLVFGYSLLESGCVVIGRQRIKKHHFLVLINRLAQFYLKLNARRPGTCDASPRIPALSDYNNPSFSYIPDTIPSAFANVWTAQRD